MSQFIAYLILTILVIFNIIVGFFNDKLPDETFNYTLLITFLGVYLSYSLNKHAETKRDEYLFKAAFAAIIVECGHNYGKVNKLLNEVSTTKFNMTKLAYPVTESIIGKDLAYKYLNNEHFYAIYSYMYQIDLVNSWCNFLYRKFVNENAQLSEKNVNDFKGELVRMQKLIYILETTLQILVNIFDVALGPKSEEKVLDKLKNLSKIKLEDLACDLKIVENMPKSERRRLHKLYKKAFRKTHNKFFSDFI